MLAGGRGFYKHHAMYHLLQRMAMAGHPLEYWCYTDEAFNRVVVTMARACHALAFYDNVMLRSVTTQGTQQNCVQWAGAMAGDDAAH